MELKDLVKYYVPMRMEGSSPPNWEVVLGYDISKFKGYNVDEVRVALNLTQLWLSQGPRAPTPSPQWSSPHNTAPPQTETGFETCRGNGRSTTAHSGGTKSHRASKPSASTRSQSPPPPGHYRRTATTSSSPSKAMPRSHPRKETP